MSYKTFGNVSDSSKDIGKTSTSLLTVNSNRCFALFVNDSDEVIYLSLGSTATLNKGIRLNSRGGAFEINTTNLYIGPVSAICASGNKRLTVLEK